MHIAAIQKTTLLDYPGKVATLIFTAWCNMRCHFCYNDQFVVPQKLKTTFKTLIEEESFFTFLEKRKWCIDGVVICWWEPTLQKDLYRFIQRVKWEWFLVKLDTNWRDPAMVQKLIKHKLVDYIAMDIKMPLHQMQTLTGVKENSTPYGETIQTLLHSSIDYEFRTTVIKRYHTIKNIAMIAQSIQWAKKYILQNFIPGKTLNPWFDWLSYNKEDLELLQSIASEYVQECALRI